MNATAIIAKICEILKVDPDAVMRDARGLSVWEARYMTWMYLHYTAGLSASSIARLFNRDRSNVFRGIRTFKNNMKYDRALRRRYENISQKIEGTDESAPSGDMKMED